MAFILLLASAGALAIKARAPGARLTLSGLLIVILYYEFQNTVAQDMELRYGPWAHAVALIAYGSGALLAAMGYARLAFNILSPRRRISTAKV